MIDTIFWATYVIGQDAFLHVLVDCASSLFWFFFLLLVRLENWFITFYVAFFLQVLDECLRAISGFRGTEDPSDENFLDTPFTSDCIRKKKVSSAPSYGSRSPEDTKEEQNTCSSGIDQWNETIEKYMPIILWHTSSMVS